MSMAYCSGVLSLDELAMSCKARTRARACLPMKPDPCGLRCYGLSAPGPSSPPCLFSIVSNGLGDSSGVSSVEFF